MLFFFVCLYVCLFVCLFVFDGLIAFTVYVFVNQEMGFAHSEKNRTRCCLSFSSCDYQKNTWEILRGAVNIVFQECLLYTSVNDIIVYKFGMCIHRCDQSLFAFSDYNPSYAFLTFVSIRIPPLNLATDFFFFFFWFGEMGLPLKQFHWYPLSSRYITEHDVAPVRPF